MGLGGGFLMTIYNATTKTAEFLNARDMAPSRATEDMFNKNPELSMDGKPILEMYLINWFKFVIIFQILLLIYKNESFFFNLGEIWKVII